MAVKGIEIEGIETRLSELEQIAGGIVYFFCELESSAVWRRLVRVFRC